MSRKVWQVTLQIVVNEDDLLNTQDEVEDEITELLDLHDIDVNYCIAELIGDMEDEN